MVRCSATRTVRCVICVSTCHVLYNFFFLNDTATTEIYTLSLHDALPISLCGPASAQAAAADLQGVFKMRLGIAKCAVIAIPNLDRKSTRLNSSHVKISYAVFCLKKKIHKEPSFATYLPTSALPTLSHSTS